MSFCFFLGGEREESALTLLLEFSLFFFAGGMEESVLALLECNTTFTWFCFFLSFAESSLIFLISAFFATRLSSRAFCLLSANQFFSSIWLFPLSEICSANLVLHPDSIQFRCQPQTKLALVFFKFCRVSSNFLNLSFVSPCYA